MSDQTYSLSSPPLRHFLVTCSACSLCILVC